MKTEYRIFNELSGRFLCDLKDDYLTFRTASEAGAYIAKKNLSAKYFKVWRAEMEG